MNLRTNNNKCSLYQWTSCKINWLWHRLDVDKICDLVKFVIVTERVKLIPPLHALHAIMLMLAWNPLWPFICNTNSHILWCNKMWSNIANGQIGMSFSRNFLLQKFVSFLQFDCAFVKEPKKLYQRIERAQTIHTYGISYYLPFWKSSWVSFALTSTRWHIRSME